MELSVLQENLSKALIAANRVASTRTQLPILSNILLRTDGTRLLVAAMNMEVSSQQYVGAKIIKPGSITIPARLLTEFITSLPKGQVTLTVKGAQLYVKSGTYSSTINGVAAEDFPELPTIDEDSAIKYVIKPSDFKQAVSQTIITTSNDATRPVLTGVYWHSEDGSLYLAGTDGYRLSQRRLVETTSEVAAIVPASSLQEVLRSITDDVAEVEVLFDEAQVRFRLDGSEITSQLIDGNFPPYQQLIPKEGDNKAIVSRDEFVRIVKVAGLFARDSGGSVTITLNEETQAISLHSVASELGENTSEAKAKVIGEGVVTLNSRFITDALSSIQGKDVHFSFNGKLAPTLFTDDEKGGNYKHIIMPLKS